MKKRQDVEGMAVGVGSRRVAGSVYSSIGGLSMGILNSLSSALGSPYSSHSLAPLEGVLWLQYVAAWLGTRWAWALLAFVVGWFAPSPLAAAVRAVSCLWCAVVAYYVTEALLGVDSTLRVREVMYWLVVSLAIGPSMALLGRTARNSTTWSLPLALVAPAIMVFDTIEFPTGPDSVRPWGQRIIHLAAIGLGVVLVIRTRISRGAPAGAVGLSLTRCKTAGPSVDSVQ